MKFSNKYFTLDVSFLSKSVVMVMKVDEDFCHTRHFEDVVPFLDSHVPNVLCTKCFNPDNLSFKEEVVNTEFGHLFEHILISLLCDEVIKTGAKSAKYRANTSWDWRKNPRGTFEITINSKVDPLIFALAFQKATTCATSMCEEQVQREYSKAMMASASATSILTTNTSTAAGLAAAV